LQVTGVCLKAIFLDPGKKWTDIRFRDNGLVKWTLKDKQTIFLGEKSKGGRSRGNPQFYLTKMEAKA